CLERNVDAALQDAATEALAQLGPPAVPAVLQACRNFDTVSSDRRDQVLYKLAQPAYRELFRAAQEKENDAIRPALVNALQSVKPTPADALPDLVAALRHDGAARTFAIG